MGQARKQETQRAHATKETLHVLTQEQTMSNKATRGRSLGLTDRIPGTLFAIFPIGNFIIKFCFTLLYTRASLCLNDAMGCVGNKIKGSSASINWQSDSAISSFYAGARFSAELPQQQQCCGWWAVCLDPKGALRWSLVLKARCLLIKSEGDRAGPGRSGGASSSQFPAFRVVARPSGPLSPLWPLRVRDQSARFVLLTINAGAVDRTGAVLRTIASSLTPDDPGVPSLASAAHLATSSSLPKAVALVPAAGPPAVAAACSPVPLAPVVAAASHFSTPAVAAADVVRTTQLSSERDY